ncbi:HNH endonuclease [uncultured Chryseobacterium sp.]|uniref:HNH endonuclease n=1 Tax=uncultured Chryseobacterium sp. TaxID=259322 RepID=UPI0025DBF4C2|nr:HNH endonuclease [uncultured Chryseobacterium sp.]
MTGDYLNKILSINAKHALYREDGKWYHNITKFPGVLFDKNGYVIFDNKVDYNNNPNLQINKDLNIKKGIQSLVGYITFTEREKELINNVDFEDNIDNEKKVRIIREIESILRNKKLVEKIKKLYKNTCQICESQIRIGENTYYSEVHHVIALGNPHNGPDTINNMICVCPNCHVMLDFKFISLDTKKFKQLKHEISLERIKYHNSLYKKKNAFFV